MRKFRNAIRTILSVSVVLSMVLSLCLVVSATDDITTEQLTYTFEDSLGSAAETVKNGGSVTVSMKAQRASETETLTFLVMLYQNNKLVVAGYDTKSVGTSQVTFETTLTLPADIEGSEWYFNTVLWSDFKTVVSKSNASLVGSTPALSGGAEVEGISVAGVAVENFDPAITTYTAEVAANATAAPRITVDTVDSGAKVEVTYPTVFPGSSTVKVTGVNGDVSTYTVNYTCSTTLVSNVNVNSDSIVEAVFKQNLQVGDIINPERSARLVTSLGEGLEGADWFQMSKWGDLKSKYPNDPHVDKTKTFMTCKVERSATVYLIYLGGVYAPAADCGFSEVHSSLKGNYITETNNSNRLYKQTLSAGSTLTLLGGGNAGGYAVIFVYDGYTE